MSGTKRSVVPSTDFDRPMKDPRPAINTKHRLNPKYPKFHKPGEPEFKEYHPHDIGVGLDTVDEAELKIASARHRSKALNHSQILRSREDSNYFMEYVFRDDRSGQPVKQDKIHREFQEKMNDPDIEDLIYEMPRDHGKTTNIEGNILWQLGNDPNLRCKVVSANDSKAVERVSAIAQHLDFNDRLKAVFPWLRPANKGEWTKHKLFLQRDRVGMRDASLEAVGVLATATGGRADRLYFDDAVDRRNALELPKLRETVKVAVDSDWANLLDPGGKTIWVCTPWHTDDCTNHLKDSGAFHAIRHPVGDDFESVWPERWPREELIKRRNKIGKRAFDRAFKLIALSGEFACINDDAINYWSGQPSLLDMLVFSGYDVATGEGEDFFGYCHVGYLINQQLILCLDAGHRQIRFSEQIDFIREQTAIWQTDSIAIESTAYQAVLAQFLEDNFILPRMVRVKPRLSKALRLDTVSPLMEQKRVLFNPRLNPKDITDKRERGDLIGELQDFPLAKNDDILDAFVYAVLLAMDFALRERQGNREKKRHEDNGKRNGRGNGKRRRRRAPNHDTSDLNWAVAES